MSDARQPPSEEQRARLRLSLLDAYLLAAGRHAEVMDAVAEARDPDEACRSVAHLLGITEDAARGVLDLRLVRFGQREVVGTRGERDDIRELLDRGRLDLGQRSGMALSVSS